LLRLIAGLARPERGALRCSDGQPLSGRLAWMGQRDDLLPWLPTRANVMLGARLRGDQPEPARADSLLERVGLTPQRDQLPATLSGGQRQRAALARTLMEDRPVVLMDEPFSALDAITRARLQSLAAGLLAGRTVLLVPHDPLEALRLGHRVHVMAGQPARIEAPILPAGEPPRDLHDPDLMRLQGDLLARLADAQDVAA
jgi:putative hydroxymethylpyrimidine transport system ATP-binding protein